MPYACRMAMNLLLLFDTYLESYASLQIVGKNTSVGNVPMCSTSQTVFSTFTDRLLGSANLRKIHILAAVALNLSNVITWRGYVSNERYSIVSREEKATKHPRSISRSSFASALGGLPQSEKADTITGFHASHKGAHQKIETRACHYQHSRF
jgi:hypothetical protein